ncbi:hypothetical protein PtA15_17A230 [Puccinia triticina]|uniref:Uncharacterized protein n=1 Tax=Puccinia triticina TaxID=208348 RepID=A0ABY7D6R0_9BASI|nr:uncharacterized protein PtA15_17A230 [Puccinia triticina]WAQ92748.1 hypothetical protein PtA15_17A230 [Puccinia triticina]
MSGQFVGPGWNSQTPFMHVNYELNLVTLLKEIQPFLLDVLKYTNQPHDELRASFLAQGEQISALNHKVNSVMQKLQTAKEKATKTKSMNAVYNFVHSVEQILCRRLNINEPWSITITQVLKSHKTNWPAVKTALKHLPDSAMLDDLKEEA